MNLSSFHLKLIGFFIVLSSPCSFLIAQNKINIEGVVYDEFDYPIPYASIGIIKKILVQVQLRKGPLSFMYLIMKFQTS